MLQIKDLTFNAWGRKFFDHASVSLPPGAKVGLIGRNGVGKSTLFKLILGQLHAGDDEISLPKSARIGSVDQEHPATPVSLLDTVLEADEERHSLLTRLEDADPEDMGEIWARLIEIDADGEAAEEVSLVAERAEDHPKVYTSVKLVYTVRGRKLNKALVERAVSLSDEKYCSATAMVKKSATVTHEVVLVEI